MIYYMSLSGIVFRITTPTPVLVEPHFARYMIYDHSIHWDVEVVYTQHFHPLIQTEYRKIGEDAQLEYYDCGSFMLSVAKGGLGSPQAITECDRNFTHLVCYLNLDTYDYPKQLSNLIALIPIRWALKWKRSLLLHASQVVSGGKGIVFTAPSGTGKTTQAKLWRKYRDAEIVCNDRVLIRRGMTYGYPFDGSEPVFSTDVHPLGAIVCLGQSCDNRIERLNPARAMAKLMSLVMYDAWDSTLRVRIADDLIRLLESVPVYQLDCTPDERAVACLERKLMEDGVIR